MNNPKHRRVLFAIVLTIAAGVVYSCAGRAGTGNLVTGVWYGNDDSSSTNNMTGGSLPAMTWREVMAFAHQGLDIRPIPGVPVEAPTVAARPARPGAASLVEVRPNANAPVTLSRRSIEVLSGIEQLFGRTSARKVQSLRGGAPVPSLAEAAGSGNARRTAIR